MGRLVIYPMAGLLVLWICSNCEIEIESIPASKPIEKEVIDGEIPESSLAQKEVPAGEAEEPATSSPDGEKAPAEETEGPPTSSPDGEEVAAEDSGNSPSSQPDTAQNQPPLRKNVIIAIGDVHGDFPALISCLQLGGAIDKNKRWIGGQMTVVQLGDVLDRGPDDRKVLDFLLNLQPQARNAGGQVVLLNGNHEIFNLWLDPGYVHSAAWDDFQDIDYNPSDPLILGFPEYQRRRWAAFAPGGQYALKLSTFPIIYVQDNVVFVHGSLFPEHVRYGISKINEEMRLWMEGKTAEPTRWSLSDMLWDRTYSTNPSPAACDQLDTTLSLVPARMLVVAHTVHLEGITSACDGKVWRVDVGMAVYYGGIPSVLKISDGQIQILN